MAHIRGLPTDSVLTVTPTAKSANIRLYDVAGTDILGSALNQPYVISTVSARFSAIMPAFASLFALRCGLSNKLAIRKITMGVAFDGTAVASTQIFSFRRSLFGTVTGGQAGITPGNIVKKAKIGAVPSTTLDIRWADFTTTTALGVAALSFELGTFCKCILNRNAGAISRFTWDFTQTLADRLILVNGEGIVLGQDNAAVVGDSLSLTVEWEEIL